MKKKIKQFILILCSFLILYCSITVALGYQKYKEGLKLTPLRETVNAIIQDDSYLTLDEISPVFIEAILAVEDPYFYSHHGIEFTKLLDAFITDLIHLDFVKGGSTISQQLAKNLFLNQEKVLSRKIAELFFVRDLEAMLSKDEILTLYLNIIYFGDGYYGIHDASKGYFNVSADKLNLDQASLLAGLPQAPAVYQLSSGYELALKRQKIVLESMVKQGLIKEEEYAPIIDKNN